MNQHETLIDSRTSHCVVRVLLMGQPRLSQRPGNRTGWSTFQAAPHCRSLNPPNGSRHCISIVTVRFQKPKAKTASLACLVGRAHLASDQVLAGGISDGYAGQPRLPAKLGARDRSQLVVIAYETGLVAPGG